MNMITLFSKLVKSILILKYFPRVTLFDLVFVFNNIDLVDEQIYGRYCGSFEDKLIQSLACIDVARKFRHTLSTHLEIGVLFGGSCLLKCLILKREKLEKKQKFIVIDPFSGYYGQKLDPTSGKPVNRKSFLTNLRRFKINPQNILIIKSLSQNFLKISPLLSEQKIISLMIDGDHSYEGVKNDFSLYAPMLIRGAYLIIDDFGDPNWPGVNEFTKKHIITHPDWKTVLHYDTTLVLEKIR